MDLIILLAVFVAFLALAYVTYRNVYNLDSRLRKIEDILKNAQVVAEPSASPAGAPEAPQTHGANTPVVNRDAPLSVPNSVPQDVSPYAARYGAAGGDSFDGPIAGWGGDGGVAPPRVTVAKEGANTRTVEIIPDDDEGGGRVDEEVESDDGDDEGDDGEVDVDDILNDMEREDSEDREDRDDGVENLTPAVSAKVADLRRALRDANVPIPSGVKKADLIRLVQEHHISVRADDNGADEEIVEDTA